MSYYRLGQRTIVFSQLEVTVPKRWVHVLPGTLIMVTKPLPPPRVRRAEFIVMSGPAKGYHGEIWLESTTPISALELLAEAADE